MSNTKASILLAAFLMLSYLSGPWIWELIA